MRVLFCGLGGIGQRHLRNLRSLVSESELEVHAYRVLGRNEKLRDDLSIDPDRSIIEDYKILVHTDLQLALAAKPEIVFICNPSSLHTNIALQAAKSGAHLFIEKPVSNTLNGIGNLINIVNSLELVCYVGYNFRFHPALIRIKELLQQRYFGKILSVRSEIGEYLPNWHRYEDYRSMYASRSDLGGGVVLSQIHEMDLLFWYFGMPESIYTLGGKLSHLEIDVEDTATSLMKYSGSFGNFSVALHQDYLQQPPVRTFKVVGDSGIAQVDLIRNNLVIHDANGEIVEHSNGNDFKRNDMFLAQMKHFLETVSGQTNPKVNLYDGIQSLRIALAAKESMSSQRVVILKQDFSNEG